MNGAEKNDEEQKRACKYGISILHHAIVICCNKQSSQKRANKNHSLTKSPHWCAHAPPEILYEQNNF